MGPPQLFTANPLGLYLWRDEVIYRFQYFPDVEVVPPPPPSGGGEGKMVQSISFLVKSGDYAWTLKVCPIDQTGISLSGMFIFIVRQRRHSVSARNRPRYIDGPSSLPASHSGAPRPRALSGGRWVVHHALCKQLSGCPFSSSYISALLILSVLRRVDG